MDNQNVSMSFENNILLCHERHISKNNNKSINKLFNNNINIKTNITNNNINNNSTDNIMKNNIYDNNDSLINNNNNNINNNNNNNNLSDLFLCQNCSCYNNNYNNNNSCCYLCSLNNNNTNLNTNETITGFLKFLARFSGRRRNFLRTLNTSIFIYILIVISLFSLSEACSARTTPKPRPPPTPTPRPNITFHTFKCPATYAEWYCLNDATCFSVKIGQEILYNCWCAEGFMGPRCEFKEIDGSFLPTRPRVMMETASIASGAILALFVAAVLCLIYTYRRQQHEKKLQLAKEDELGRSTATATNGNGIDTVDGTQIVYKCEHHAKNQRRPFGPHHYSTLPLAATIKR